MPCLKLQPILTPSSVWLNFVSWHLSPANKYNLLIYYVYCLGRRELTESSHTHQTKAEDGREWGWGNMKGGDEVQTGKRYLHTIDNWLGITIQNIQITLSNKVEKKQTICMFPIAAATNYHKLSGSQQHRFILSLCSRPENQTGSHWAQIKVSARAMFLLKALGKKNHFFAFSHF